MSVEPFYAWRSAIFRGNPADICWEVAGGSTVVMNSWSTDRDGKEVMIDVVIEEPTIVQAFRHYFDGLWESIAPSHKDKRQVIGWIEQQLAQLSEAAS